MSDAYSEVQRRVSLAAARSGRKASDIRIIAVSKFQAVEKVSQLAALGHRDFGENYVQEWDEKRALMGVAQASQLRWHLIGPLQRNKVKFVVGQCELIQSVDRFELAREISKVALDRNLRQDILLQVRIGDEDTKNGVAPELAADLLAQVSALQGLSVRGMMVLPPLTAVEGETRRFLRESRVLFDRLKETSKDFSVLSMGTSHDFEWAVEEGATMVRVGTLIFGSRA